jgi:hypothetical protein
VAASGKLFSSTEESIVNRICERISFSHQIKVMPYPIIKIIIKK